MAGAVNTVHCVDGQLVGYNTDGRGLLEALRADAGFDPAGKNVVILGAGGAAGSLSSRSSLRVRPAITLVNRDVARAEELAERMSSHSANIWWSRLGYPRKPRTPFARPIWSSTRPRGDAAGRSRARSRQSGSCRHRWSSTWSTGPGPRPRLVDAAEAGAPRTLDGLGMLVCQGATAVDIWNVGCQSRTPRDVMLEAARDEIADRAGKEAGPVMMQPTACDWAGSSWAPA